MSELKFSKTHEWIKIEGDTATIGITKYAQSQLGDVVFVDLASVSDKLKQASQFGTIESTKAASELYTPLSGDVIEVNRELADNPQWANESPQDKAWMIKLKISQPQELESLMDEEAYKNYLAKESH